MRDALTFRSAGALVVGVSAVVVLGCTFNPGLPHGTSPPGAGYGGGSGSGGTGTAGAPAPPKPCTNLACQQSTCALGACTVPACAGGARTTVSGTIMDPAGKVP